MQHVKAFATWLGKPEAHYSHENGCLRAYIIRTFLYGSEPWTTYAGQQKRLNVFHLRCLRGILSMSSEDHIANSAVLERAGIPEASAVDWLCTSNGREPHSQAILVLRTRTRGKADRMTKLRFKDVAKRDMQAIGLFQSIHVRLLPVTGVRGKQIAPMPYETEKSFFTSQWVP